MPAIAATMYPQAFRRQSRIPPTASAGTMTVVSSAATSRKASGSRRRPAREDVRRPHPHPDEGEPRRDEHEVAPDYPHGCLRPEARAYHGGIDPRQRKDERDHGQHECRDVEWEEGVERRAQHVIRVVVRSVAEHAEPQ